MPVEVTSEPMRLTVRDPESLAWGSTTNGAACAMASETSDAQIGDRVWFDFALRADSTAMNSEVYLAGWRVSELVLFTFRNTATGAQFERDIDAFRGGPAYIPSDSDFLPLRADPPLLWSIPIRLVSQSGEQIPPGDYEVTATFQDPNGKSKSNSNRTFVLLQGPQVSGPVAFRIRDAAPDAIEILVPGGVAIERQQQGWCWSLSSANPRTVRLLRQPGFCLSSQTVTSVAVDGGEFERVSTGGMSSNAATGIPELGEFWQTLRADAVRALDEGRPVEVRVELAIYESGDWHPRFPQLHGSPLYRATLEARRP